MRGRQRNHFGANGCTKNCALQSPAVPSRARVAQGDSVTLPELHPARGGGGRCPQREGAGVGGARAQACLTLKPAAALSLCGSGGAGGARWRWEGEGSGP